MSDYDFRSLSPHDFELLCRDILQKPLGVQLESFTAGRDCGIDFRYRWGDANLTNIAIRSKKGKKLG